MIYVKVKGIVTKEVNVGESDKILTVISDNCGKISTVAKGARRSRSKLVAGTQFLCYSDFVLFKGRGMYHINSCEVIESFYKIRNDITRLTYSAHLVEILNDTVQENQPAPKVLQFFLNTLHMLIKENREPELVTRVFELRLMSMLGYAPYVGGCIICDKGELDKISFSFKKCGFICDKDACTSNDKYSMNVLPGTARAICHIISAPMEDLFRFDISSQVLSELGKITQRYLRDRLEKNYKKLDFLKNLI